MATQSWNEESLIMTIQEDNFKQFFSVLRANDSEKKEILSYRLPAYKGKTFLHLACMRGALQVTNVILMHCYNTGDIINIRDEEGRVPLHWACKGGFKSIVEALLRKKAEVHMRDNDGKLPEELIPESSREEIMKVMSQQMKQRTIQHAYLICGVRFDVDERYLLLRAIGKGSYGLVCSAKDQQSSEMVAIKKISRAFERAGDTVRIIREIKILQHFNHENIIGVRDILRPPSFQEFEDIYLVFELLDTDLYQIISSEQPLSEGHFQYFLYQILRGLKCIHSANILHRDIKPSNVFVRENCDLKIGDFGLARGSDPEAPEHMTEYVATRWYRAPEVILESNTYGPAVDVWSVGCIFAEMLGRAPLFPGKNYIHQLECILDVLGTPTDEDCEAVRGSPKAMEYLRRTAKRPAKPLSSVFPQASPLALDLLDSLLQFNPSKRISVEDALSHEYLKAYHYPPDEPVADKTFEFQVTRKTPKDILKQIVYDDIITNFHSEPEAPATPEGEKSINFDTAEDMDAEMMEESGEQVNTEDAEMGETPSVPVKSSITVDEATPNSTNQKQRERLAGDAMDTEENVRKQVENKERWSLDVPPGIIKQYSDTVVTNAFKRGGISKQLSASNLKGDKKSLSLTEITQSTLVKRRSDQSLYKDSGVVRTSNGCIYRAGTAQGESFEAFLKRANTVATASGSDANTAAGTGQPAGAPGSLMRRFSLSRQSSKTLIFGEEIKRDEEKRKKTPLDEDDPLT